jgi:hypothetical protein
MLNFIATKRDILSSVLGVVQVCIRTAYMAEDLWPIALPVGRVGKAYIAGLWRFDDWFDASEYSSTSVLRWKSQTRY